MNGADETRFVLRFTGSLVDAHGAAPAAFVAAALANMQRLAHLVGMQQERRELGQRARPPAIVQERYLFLCGVSEPGSLLEPVRLVSLEGGLIADQVARGAGRTLSTFLRAVQQGNASAVHDTAPDKGYRRLMLAALLAMAPPPSGAVKLDILDGNLQVALSMDDARPCVEAMLRPQSNIDREGILTGRLDEIDFARRSMLILETSSQRKLTCLYDDSLESMLLDHPRELLQVHGTIVRDSEGRPEGIQGVTRIEVLDKEPFYVERFVVDGDEIVCAPPLDLPVDFEEATGTLSVSDAALGINAYGETRERLNASLRDELDVLWRCCANADPSELADDALALRARLLQRWSAQSADAA